MSHHETIWMKWWCQLSGKIRKYINLLSAEFTHSDNNDNTKENDNKPESQMWIANMNCKYESQSPMWITDMNRKRIESIANWLTVQSWNRTQTAHKNTHLHYTVTFKSINQQTFMYTCWTEPCQENVSSGQVQTAKAQMRLHSCILIRAFAVCCQNHWIL